MNKRHEHKQRGRGGRFPRRRGRSHGESGRSNVDQDKTNQNKGKSEWKEENSYRGRGSYSRGSYSRGNNNYKSEDRTWFKGTCFKYGEGHRAFECTDGNSRKKLGNSSRNALVQEDLPDSMNRLENGENLMIRRALWNEETDENPVMRKSLFKTRYKIAGKCCKEIIDSGSSDNLASEELVTKLQLPRMKHPKPYQIVWIRDNHKLLVSEQCLVKLKIGSYHDEVLCDIMLMDCCHILLGRPWQNDRQAWHDGRLNSYTIVANGMRQVLLSLIEDSRNENCTTIRVCLVEGKQFTKDLKKDSMCYALILRKPDKRTEYEQPLEI